MKYIISENQYQLLLQTEQEYGKQIKMAPETTTSGYEYGKQISSSSGNTTNTGTTQPNKFVEFNTKIFKDKEEKIPYGNYPVKKITKLPDNSVEIDLGSFKAKTTCEKVLKNDTSLQYGNNTYYSKELVSKTGCKS